MDTNTNIVRSVPSVVVSLEHLTDAELLAGTRRLVGRSNQLLAELLAHLAEVEGRGIHRTRACSSLYTYCTYELRFSEDEAFRRVAAARLVRRFPALLDALASGELHLTGLLMLGPHLTEANLAQVLARAKHRTKREIAALVRRLDPLPAVPACIEPLGPAPARIVPKTPTWEEFVGARCPIRELVPGDRPREWVEGANDAATGTDECGELGTFGGAESDPAALARLTPTAPEPTDATASEQRAELAATLSGPQRFKVQFTATEEYVKLIDEAKALLSHAAGKATIEHIQLRAMRVFVAGLKKRRYGAKKSSSAFSREPDALNEPHEPGEPDERDERREPLEQSDLAADVESVVDANVTDEEQQPHSERHPEPRRRGRHIPAAVRRAVFERDGACCTYIDATGRRCTETHLLEFHHLTPFARGGPHTSANLTLRCAAHNALAAVEDFGAELILARKFARHESFSAMTVASRADAARLSRTARLSVQWNATDPAGRRLVAQGG